MGLINRIKDVFMRQLLFFDSMIVPKIITFIYWLMLAGALFSGLGIMVNSGLSLISLIMGLVSIAVGAVVARISCDMNDRFF